MISVTCACGESFQAPREAEGKRMKCPACGGPVSVPRFDNDDDEEFAGSPLRTSRNAIVSLSLGVLSFLCTVFAGVPAIITGVLALRDIDRSRSRLGGRGLAIGGIVTGGIGSLLVAPALLIGLMFPAVQRVRGAAERAKSMNNLKMIGLAMHEYESEHGEFPPAMVCDAQGQPLYSWRVLLLPYLMDAECQALFQRFNLAESWDSPANQALLDQMPQVYRHPTSQPNNQVTVYQVFLGQGAMFEPEDPKMPLRELSNKRLPKGLFTRSPAVKIVHVTDGASNTVMAAEANYAIPWTRPWDLQIEAGKAPPKLGVTGASHVNLLYADGSVRNARLPVAEATLRGLISRKGGEAVFLP